MDLHVTTIGRYDIYRIVSDHDWTVQVDERTAPNVTHGWPELTPAQAQGTARDLRAHADTNSDPADARIDLDLADALDAAAEEPAMCVCRHRYASWGDLCTGCYEHLNRRYGA